jgi:YegS/Rv2252/BmrU family lipid kinase
MPGSFSFPSGHSASALAFTTAAALEDPATLAVTAPLASAVAYSRVHVRVHYPLDVVAGAAIGFGMGVVSRSGRDAAQRWWDQLTPIPAELRPSTDRLVLVSSPRAGGAGKMQRARNAIARHGLGVAASLQVDQLDRLPRLLEKMGSSQVVVVAAGGDGTVGAVADAIYGTDALMGILPLGTSNDFARSLEIPMGLESAVRLLARGPIRQVHLGRLSADGRRPRHFVHAAATGLNVAFARFATRGDLRQRLGRLTYAAAAALALRERPVFDCEVEYQGRVERLNLVHLSVVNAPVFGGFLDLRLPRSSLEDQSLLVIMIEHLPIRRLLRSALYPALGLHRSIRGFRSFAVSDLVVRPSQSMDVTLDGELVGKLPGRFSVVPSALRVLAPFKHESNTR